MRDHSRSSTSVGSRVASRRKQCRSVRNAEAITSQSRLSSFAPATVNRSRNRSTCLGLIECTLNPRSISVSTTGAMRHLDSNKDCIRRAVGGGDEPVRHTREPLTAVLDLESAKPLALVVGDDNIMLLTRPIYGGVPTLCLDAHSRLQDQTHAPRACLRSHLFLYWRSQLGTAGRGLPTGCRSQPIRRGTSPKRVLVARDAGSAATANRLGRGRMRPSALPI